MIHPSRAIRSSAAALAGLLLAATWARAVDQVELNSGAVLRGVVTEQGEDSVTIRVAGGTTMTLSMDQVRRVVTANGATEGKTASPAGPVRSPGDAPPVVRGKGDLITLAEGGEARMRILRGASIKAFVAALNPNTKKRGRYEIDPVEELKTYLDRISGGTFEVADAEEGAEGIYVGIPADFPWLKPARFRPAELKDEGFVLRSEGPNLLLIGGGVRGAQHAITTLLHSLGCRWFFPGAAWEIVPSRPDLSGAWGSREAPSFSMQRKIGLKFFPGRLFHTDD